MKTTFSKVFEEFDDNLMTTEMPCVSDSVDVDVSKIKADVFARIENKDGKKKSKKRIITLLVAAVILVTCTVGAVATGSVEKAFGRFFKSADDMNYLGLYDGGTVVTNCPDKNLDVKLLGVTGDGQNIYAAIEITKKDGSAVIDEEYTWKHESDNDKVSGEVLPKDSDAETKVSGGGKFKLSQDNKVVNLYMTYFVVEGDMSDGRVVVRSEGLNAYKVDKVYASIDHPKSMTEEGAEAFLTEGDRIYEEQGLDKVDDLLIIDYDGKRSYVSGESAYFELPFEISFELNYNDRNFIKKDISHDTARNVVTDYARNTEMEITPFGVCLSGECGIPKGENQYTVSCFKGISRTEDTSKLIMNDGTVYYLYYFEFPLHKYDEDTGVFSQKERLKLYRNVGGSYYPETIVIDTREVNTVIINGDVVYSK